MQSISGAVFGVWSKGRTTATRHIMGAAPTPRTMTTTRVSGGWVMTYRSLLLYDPTKARRKPRRLEVIGVGGMSPAGARKSRGHIYG